MSVLRLRNRKKLTEIEGVERVGIDLEKGEAVVVMREGASLGERQARRAVAEAGFTLRAFGRAEGEGNEQNGSRNQIQTAAPHAAWRPERPPAHLQSPPGRAPRFSAAQASPIQGLFLAFTFGLGRGLPFLAAGVAGSAITGFMRLGAWRRTIQVVSGCTLLVVSGYYARVFIALS